MPSPPFLLEILSARFGFKWNGWVYGAIGTQLELAGPIGGDDPLIAAHAKALGCTVVTDISRSPATSSAHCGL